MFSKKATKFDQIFTVHLTLCSKCQIDGKDFVNFCGLFRKHELYNSYSADLEWNPHNPKLDDVIVQSFHQAPHW